MVPKEIFLQTQAEMARHRRCPSDFNYLHDWPLSGRVVCEECGCTYRRVYDKRYGFANYRCEAKVLKYKHPDVDCKNKGIREEALQNAVIEAFNRLPETEAELIRLDERLKWAGISKADEMLREIRAKMIPLEQEAALTEDQQKELDELGVQWAEVSDRRAVYADKELQIRNLLQRIAAMKGEDDGERDSEEHGACDDAEEFWRITAPKFAPGPVAEFPGDEVIRLVEKVMIRADKITVRFKAGISIEVKR